MAEFEQSGLRRKEFCAARGLSVHTLDAWRRRVAESGREEKIVAVEFVAERATATGSMRAASAERGGQFRVLLATGIRIEVEAGFDAGELRRLIATLDGAGLCGSLAGRV